MTRPFRKYPRGKYWNQQRDAAMERAGRRCEVSGDWLGYIVLPSERFVWRRAVHHVIAERFARKWIKGCDPHILKNLVVITPSLHAKITALERKLTRTDWLGYRIALYRLGFDLEQLDAAFRALCESAKSTDVQKVRK